MPEINMDEKVSVTNIAPWNVGFPSASGRGDICFPPGATVRLRREEIVEQVNMRNRLIAGLDSYGSHATLYIEDEDTRKYLEFDSEDGKRKQKVISKGNVEKWFSIRSMQAFIKTIKDNVKTRAEKQFLLKAIEDLKLDSHEKIEFCKEYCRFSLRGV